MASPSRLKAGMIDRVPEPEVMDEAEDALAYDAMDHSVVNAAFATDCLAHGEPRGPVLDLGAGNGLIPILLAERLPGRVVVAADASPAMLAMAVKHIRNRGVAGRVRPDLVRAQRLWHHDGSFPLVVSNSLIHHLADPLPALHEAWRVASPGGRLFFRDLARPEDESTLADLVKRHAADAPPRARALFTDSLRAAFTVGEMRDMVARLGCGPETVSMTSDRHWTWSAIKPRS
jgi:ubiquinone/menaquinone biosynthesis C-methylase UbiE